MTSERFSPILLVIIDFALTLLVFNLVGHYRGITNHFTIWPLGAPFATLAFALYLVDGYRPRTDLLSVDYTSMHVIAMGAATIVVLLFAFVFLPAGYELQSSRGVIAVSFLLLTPLTLAFRRIVYLQIISDKAPRTFVFLGDSQSCEAFREECQKMHMKQPVVLATLGTALDGGVAIEDPGMPRSMPQLLAEAQSGHLPVEAIILRESSRDLKPAMVRQLVELYFGGIPTYTLELFHQVYWRKIPLYRLNQTWLFQEGFRAAREPVFERLKRISDIVFSALGLLLCLPLVVGIGLAIWLEDRGPVFFFQTRIGKNYVPFRLVKFRTMRQTKDGDDPYTQMSDNRITRVGQFLRTKRLDELPQLWNVMLGEMSLIGPRAEWDRLVREYDEQIPFYYYRHLVKPGITGWAQVNYLYGANLEDTIRKLEYDLYYIRHFSFSLDASIVLKTFQVIIFGKGR